VQRVVFSLLRIMWLQFAQFGNNLSHSNDSLKRGCEHFAEKMALLVNVPWGHIWQRALK